jgi:ribosomal subunit interface protein
MQYTLTARNVSVNDELRDLIEKRLQPLERVLGDALVSAEFVLSTARHLCVSELIVHARGDHRLHALAEETNWPAAVGTAVDKVSHQAHTLKGKWQDRRRHAVPVSESVEPEAEADDTTSIT